MARLGTYEELATEYYDSARHPTCANFREASDAVLARWVQPFEIKHEWVCEVGVGKSALAPIVRKGKVSLRRLLLIDSSPSMLSYSLEWRDAGAHPLLADASRLPMGDLTIGLLVASLGDAYNVPDFWREIARVLVSGGEAIFTTPSYEWAHQYRDSSEVSRAIFDLSDGDELAVPSLILPPEAQVELIESCGLVPKAFEEVRLGATNISSVSPKLMPERGSDASIVSAYLVGR
jgi:SAM-dependent methyltransferase